MLRKLLLTACAGAFLISSCKKSDSNPSPGSIQFSISNEVDGQPIQMGPLNFQNAKGNDYSVSMLKYYLSNFSLLTADGTEVPVNSSYYLIDASLPASESFSIADVPAGAYTKLRFHLGVDSLHNHSGTQSGALDPVHGMIWNWNTGYIFFKHEGSYKDSLGNVTPLAFHYGSDRGYVQVELPLSNLNIDGNTRKITLGFNLNGLYANPIPIDFNLDNNRTSGNRDDVFWEMTMRSNFPGAFQIIKTE
ncbi:MAG: hypothetical protein JST06_00670 [Bacteroidetes bacterium]|nr:hypothetical protein [Bacteroidota bacterium]MBS1630042.1 hypothetical protein [Bacteroidota bacterium]